MYKNIEIYSNNQWYKGQMKFENKIIEISRNEKIIIIPYNKIESITREKNITILVYYNGKNNEITQHLKLENIDHEELVTSYQSDMPIIEPFLQKYNNEIENAKDDIKNNTKELIIKIGSGLMIVLMIILVNLISLDHNFKLLILLYFILFLNIIILLSTFTNKK